MSNADQSDSGTMHFRVPVLSTVSRSVRCAFGARPVSSSYLRPPQSTVTELRFDAVKLDQMSAQAENTPEDEEDIYCSESSSKS